MTANRQVRREARQLFKDCLVGAHLDEGRVRRVVIAIIEAGRRRGPAILASFARLVRLDRERHTARIASAAPLSPDLRERIVARLAAHYRRDLQAEFTESPRLIGGVQITIDSDVYDWSVRGR